MISKPAYQMGEVLDKFILYSYVESGNCIEIHFGLNKWVYLRCATDRTRLVYLGVHSILKDFSTLNSYQGEWHESEFS